MTGDAPGAPGSMTAPPVAAPGLATAPATAPATAAGASSQDALPISQGGALDNFLANVGKTVERTFAIGMTKFRAASPQAQIIVVVVTASVLAVTLVLLVYVAVAPAAEPPPPDPGTIVLP